MKVNDVYTPIARTCRRTDNLAEAAGLMWKYDFGALPVVDDGGKPVGVITDRDICMAVATRNRRASEIRVGEVMSGRVLSCRLEDSLRSVLETLRKEQIRRLPVVDAKGRLSGMISLSDLVRVAQQTHGSKVAAVSYDDLILTVLAIYAPHPTLKSQGAPGGGVPAPAAKEQEP